MQKTFRVYLRNNQQQVFDKTVTSDQDAALAAFSNLISRYDLDGTDMLAVLNCNNKPVAHHLFALRADGTPLDPSKNWRGALDEIRWPM